jgi:hypothetical protein
MTNSPEKPPSHASPKHAVIEIRVPELRHLFHEIDPSPFGERDLDPRVEEFIVSWAEDLPAAAALALVIHVEKPPSSAESVTALEGAVRRFFSHRALERRRRLRSLFRRGRVSLVIGLACLTLSIAAGDLVVSRFVREGLADIVRESLLIGGWVAMWRPLEVFLYNWWPIRASARLFERLSAMPVTVAGS